ncbi:uncharacterized protein F5147DRAFT_776475 [Suillus discolor]|uniref:Uncharacterized protein n=1 Tax=Suillus discolor TaxID=1912936 RepID=A0A9P7JRE5_9AGAM|nr:uncharacterized protein F5147DRAFT_776475 [Suillus discolor]KAG2101826.1 hypothetical protein F5147DRAFT_776475 [Suillus discolor]
MVHPTIHHTVEAKQQAAREKHKRYYERDAILLRRRLCRTNNTPSVTAESNTNNLSDDEVDFEAIITLSDCLGLVHDAKNKVLALVPSGIPTTYVEGILRKYAMSLRTSVAGVETHASHCAIWQFSLGSTWHELVASLCVLPAAISI